MIAPPSKRKASRARRGSQQHTAKRSVVEVRVAVPPGAGKIEFAEDPRLSRPVHIAQLLPAALVYLFTRVEALR